MAPKVQAVLNVQDQAKHIVAIEDTIEHVHAPKKCAGGSAEVGAHAPSFQEALRSVMRRNPDLLPGPVILDGPSRIRCQIGPD